MSKELRIPEDGTYKAYDRRVSGWLGDPAHDRLVPGDPSRCPAENVEQAKYAFRGRTPQCGRPRDPADPDGLCWQHAKMRKPGAEGTA